MFVQVVFLNTTDRDMQTMTQEQLTSTSFNNFLDSFKDDAREEISKNYFHVDVVAEAYNKGFSDGKSEGLQNHLKGLVDKHVEDFKKRYLQAYILTSKIVDTFSAHDRKPVGFYINIHDKNPSVVISINDDYLLEDEFVEVAYKNIYETQEIFNTIFKKHHLDISLVGIENLDGDLLNCEGFNYYEEIK